MLVYIFYGHLVCFRVIWYILRHFGTFYCHQVYFPHFGKFFQEKSGNPMTPKSLKASEVNKGLNCFSHFGFALDGCVSPMHNVAQMVNLDRSPISIQRQIGQVLGTMVY
jgi:hypothetical protein